MREKWAEANAAAQRKIVLRALDSVAALHRSGLLHGDLKPDHFLFADRPGERTPLLIDFGMVTAVGTEAWQGATPAYMAPEVLAGEPPSPRSDVYSLGLTLLSIATDRAEPSPRIPSHVMADPLLGRLLPRMLRKRPKERWANAESMLLHARELGGVAIPWEPPHRLPFVGRETQVLKIKSAMTDENGPMVLSLDGPEGVGRRRLMDECARSVQIEGHPSIRLDRGHAADEALFLLRLVLGIGRDSPPPEDPHLPPGSESIPSHERMALALHKLLAGQHLLIGQDPGLRDADLHDLLKALLDAETRHRSMGGKPRLTLVTCDSHEAWSTPQSSETVAVTPLSQSALKELLEGLFHGASAVRMAEAARILHQKTGGLPLLVDATLRTAAEHAALSTTGVNLPDALGLLDQLPENAGLYLTQEFESLPQGAQEVLRILAVSLRPLGESRLHHLVADPETLRTHLPNLEARGLITRDTSDDEVLLSLRYPGASRQFLSDIKPDALLDIYDALGASAEDPPEALEFTLHGRTPENAAETLTAGLATLEHRGELFRLGTLAELALSKLSLPPDRAAATRLYLVRSLMLRGRQEDAWRELAQVTPPDDLRLRTQWARLAAEREFSLGHGEAGESHLLGLLKLDALDPATDARIRSILVYALLQRGALADAAAVIDSARDGNTPDVLFVRGLLARRRGQLAKAREALTLASSQFESTGAWTASGVTVLNRALAEMASGDLTDAATSFQRCIALFGPSGHENLLARTLTNLGILEAARGNLEESRRLHTDAETAFIRMGDLERSVTCRASRGIAWLHQGHAHAASNDLADAMDWFQLTDATGCIATARRSRALSLLGRSRSARRMAARAIMFARRRSDPRLMAEGTLAAAVVIRRGTRPPHVDRRAITWAEESGHPSLQAEAQALLRSQADSNAPSWLKAWQWWLTNRTPPEFPPTTSEIAEAMRNAHGARNPYLSWLIGFSWVRRDLMEGKTARAWRSWRRLRGKQAELESSMTERARTIFRLSEASNQLQALAETIETQLATAAMTTVNSHQGLVDLLKTLSSMGGEMSKPALLDLILDAALKLTGAENAYIILSESDQLVLGAGRNCKGEPSPLSTDRISTSLVQEALSNSTLTLVADAASDERYRRLFSVRRNEIRALAIAPLRFGGNALGALYLDGGLGSGAFPEAQHPLICAYADMAAILLHNQLKRLRNRMERENLRIELDSERVLTRELRRLNRESDAVPQIIGTSRNLKAALKTLDRIAGLDLPLLIRGETGVGKELFARRAHALSSRGNGPLQMVNVASLPRSLFESQMMGHTRGAFTGAASAAPGIFQLAHGGTVVLDEISALEEPQQASLLRILQERAVRPLGGQQEIPVDVRIIAISNEDLLARLRSGSFREDLYYRLKGAELLVPPLRDRLDDIPILAMEFVKRDGFKTSISQEAKRCLMNYRWPGNVRQLEGEVRRAAAVHGGDVLEVEHLSDEIRNPDSGHEEPAPPARIQTLKEVEERAVRRALALTDGDRKAAAAALGISRSTLYAKLKTYGSNGA